MNIQPFSDLVPKYDIILFDAYGVLKNSAGVLKGVPDLLYGLEQPGVPTYVLTNDASRTASQCSHKWPVLAPLAERPEPVVPPHARQSRPEPLPMDPFINTRTWTAGPEGVDGGREAE